MPRPLRVHVPGGIYHVTLRGNHQQAVFVDEGDQRLLNCIVARALQTFGARLHAYCWMTNHLHLLMQVDQQPLSKPMWAIALEFARAMQKKLDRTGHYFERRYFAALVDVDSYFLELIRYIHLNPVRAGIANDPGRYAWSSHHAYVGSRQESWVTTEFALRMFGHSRISAVTAYRRFLDCEDAALWSPDHVKQEPQCPSFRRDDFSARAEFVPPARQTLDELIAEACARFELTRQRVESPLRDAYVSKVRAWIAHQAVTRHICGLSAVARALRRDESTLRQAVRAYPQDVE
jgi:putative transposase